MPISVMIKPASSECNLRCEYCFYHSLAQSRNEYSKGFMSYETAKNIIKSALDFADGSDVYFTFQGGEPLLCPLDFFEFFTEYTEKCNLKSSPIHFCLQTNGTLITDEYARFFKQKGYLVGVSLDGDSELNKYRAYKDGKSSFDDAFRGIKLLQKHGVSFNVLSVLTKNTALNFRKAYRFFKSNGLNYMQFITGLCPFSGEYSDELYMNNDDFAYFLKKAFNIYYNDIMRGEAVSVRTFDNYILLARGENAEQCGMNGCCSTQFVVEGDGSVYPCDFYCCDEWYLANINTSGFKEIFSMPKTAEFLKTSFKIDEKCKNCKYFYLCRGGGCRRNRESADYCEAYKEFFDTCELKFADFEKRS